jgi:hypothetical protein
MGRNYLRGPEGVRINTILAAAGYNFGLLLHWLAELLRAFIVALTLNQTDPSGALTILQARFFSVDYLGP